MLHREYAGSWESSSRAPGSLSLNIRSGQSIESRHQHIKSRYCIAYCDTMASVMSADKAVPATCSKKFPASCQSHSTHVRHPQEDAQDLAFRKGLSPYVGRDNEM